MTIVDATSMLISWTRGAESQSYSFMEVVQRPTCVPVQFWRVEGDRVEQAWLPVRKTCDSRVQLVGVALGVLCDALTFRARDPVLNRMRGELALRVAPSGLDWVPYIAGRSGTSFAMI